MQHDEPRVDKTTGELMFAPATVLDPFNSFELCDGKHALFAHRLRIEEATALLKEYKARLDEELVRIMKSEGETEFMGQMRGRTAKIYFANEKKEEATDTRRLVNMLHGNEGDAAQEMAFAALSRAKSKVWSTSKLRVLADTMGIDQKELVTTKYTDRVKVSAVDNEILERAKKSY